MRNIATGGIFAGLDKGTRLKLINKNIRTISRVIIEPRFRSLGLAVRLVKETMPIMDVPFVEALAVMGRANPFFEKAGLTRYDAPISASCVRLIEAFSAVGVDEQDLIDPGIVQQKLGLDARYESRGRARGRFYRRRDDAIPSKLWPKTAYAARHRTHKICPQQTHRQARVLPVEKPKRGIENVELRM